MIGLAITSADPSDTRHGLCWYAIHTKPKKEAVSVTYISRLGIEAFSPTIKKDRQIFGAVRETETPLFPCYIFARLNESDMHSVKYARGVRRVVGAGDLPTPIDEPVITFIKSQFTGRPSCRPSQLQPGDRIIVNRGVFYGLEGVLLEERSAKERVRVLLKTIEGQAQVVVDKGLVERVYRPGY